MTKYSHREVVGVAEGMKEDRASWEQFVRSLIERGLRGVRLVVGDRCAGLVATVNSMLPDARYQRCTVHFMRNVLSRVSRKHAAWAAGALKAVFAVFCQVGVGCFGVSFSPCERRVSGRFGVGRSCWLLVIALVIA